MAFVRSEERKKCVFMLYWLLKNAFTKDESDPSKLSLMERMKLFERPSVQPAAVPAPVARSSPRKSGQRFKTQPVTSHEVHLARSIRRAASSASSSPPAAQKSSPVIG